MIFKMDGMYLSWWLFFFYTIFAAPQNPEVNDQFKSSTPDSESTVYFIETGNTAAEVKENPDVNVTKDKEVVEDINVNKDLINNEVKEVTVSERTDIRKNVRLRMKPVKDLEANFFSKIYTVITRPISTFMAEPKVNTVLRNIGTCVVNGAMELLSYYLPAPLMPLVASAAGMVIPFEPVVMLRDRMPVTSYRRALKTAVKSFLGSFKKYKPDEDNFDDDPYMTMRFNRRFMRDKSNEKKDND